MFNRRSKVGPGAMVAAAFIGPGTVTTATIAGSSYGYTLLWAVLFSVFATLVLQEMAARLGVSTQLGLGEAIRHQISHPVLRGLLAFLIIAAIFVGNAAYEAGNIRGAVLGLDFNRQTWPFNPWILLIGIIAFTLLWRGQYRLIERSLVTLVSLMGIVFLLTALLVKPSLPGILSGLLLPVVPNNSLVMVVSLIGTTVVPYNLFLHAATAAKRWNHQDLYAARLDTLISVLGGGLITMAILITASAAFAGTSREINNISDLSSQLMPLLGNWSLPFMSLGFFAAGLSSAITAPLAASFATSEILGWPTQLHKNKFKVVWLLVLAAGLFFSSLNIKPTTIILFAQFANGLLLPILAITLLWIMNNKKLLGTSINGTVSNLMGVVVVLITIILSIKSIGKASGFWF